jgi:hypothetical protein
MIRSVVNTYDDGISERHRLAVSERAAKIRSRNRRVAFGTAAVAASASILVILVSIGSIHGSDRLALKDASGAAHSGREHVAFGLAPTTSVPTSSDGKNLGGNAVTPITPGNTSPTPPSSVQPNSTATVPTPTTPSAVQAPTGGIAPPAASGPIASHPFVNVPSGTTQTVTTHTSAPIILNAPLDGYWGTATVTGDANSVSIEGQSIQSDGTVVVDMETNGPGTVTISIPAVGAAAGNWSITVVVAGNQPSPCNSNGVCS